MLLLLLLGGPQPPAPAAVPCWPERSSVVACPLVPFSAVFCCSFLLPFWREIGARTAPSTAPPPTALEPFLPRNLP